MSMRCAVVAVMALLPGVAMAAAEPNVCEALAPQIGLKRVELSKGAESWTEWRAEMATLGHHLIGGAVVSRIGVEPADAATATGDDYRRVRDMCETSKKGAECRLVGPVRINLVTRRGEATAIAPPGESASVGIRNTRIWCRAG